MKWEVEDDAAQMDRSVSVSVKQGDLVLGTFRKAAMASGDAEDAQLPPDARPSHAEALEVDASWLNVHGLKVRYRASLVPIGGQHWSGADDVVEFSAKSVEIEGMQFV